MIKVTIWNEFVQEQLCEETLEKFGFEGMPEDEKREISQGQKKSKGTSARNPSDIEGTD